MIRPARIDELPTLSDLCFRSKAYWGYDDAFMAACREELTLAADDLESGTLIVVEDDGRPVGVAQVVVEGDVADLHHFFVDPVHMGQGYGRRLFDACSAEARRLGAHRLTIEADPGARPFYERMGAVVIGEAPSASIPGRVLPLLELDLRAGLKP